ncbi:MAG: RNA-binding protein [Candidatus Aminicenantes bacterium]|nr:RNA-binding protein [Candidatus Aminicenantes bacterium]OQX52775.1 MAG: RNA-binding protein [Candidatus Aminicenantes bacterium 4484_214]RLE00964.1 MAG: RNA-binding protein [Candidatus Aminicenantes bacterium]RLE04363.1 MAG: RNA-binding protein [Candidatus Aminicenantes bacterium]HHF42948.1 RNA-binding protein [Candidatus Aminicenantes bacterium]
MSIHIYVGNLNYRMSEESLRKLFEQYGEVVSAKIIKDRMTGRSRGFGFVEMSDSEEANEAIKSLDGKEVEGRNLRVNRAKSQ